MKHPITKTRNGAAVYVNLLKSPAGTHIAEQPHVLSLIKEALEQTSLKAGAIRMERDMGRDIGYDYVAETGESDAVFYARLVREEQYIRFVKKGKPQATRYLTIILVRSDAGEYELLDTWVGRLSPPLPGRTDEAPESKDYWSSHAHIFDHQPIQLRTITNVCPY